MKNKLLLLAMLAALMLTACKHTKSHHDSNDEEEEEQAVGLIIDEEHFPDDAFRAFLLEQDFGRDSVLTAEEEENVYRLKMYHQDIRSLQGIEHFQHLGALLITGNPLEQLVLPRMEQLAILDCQCCELTKLDVTQCPRLNKLRCFLNKLTTLDLSNKPRLTELEAHDNLFTDLNLSGTDSLNVMDVSNNQLTRLDLSSQKNLHCIAIGGNPMDEEQMSAFINQLPKGVVNETGFDEHIEIIDPNISVGDRTLTPAQEQALEQKGWYHK